MRMEVMLGNVGAAQSTVKCHELGVSSSAMLSGGARGIGKEESTVVANINPDMIKIIWAKRGSQKSVSALGVTNTGFELYYLSRAGFRFIP